MKRMISCSSLLFTLCLSANLWSVERSLPVNVENFKCVVDQKNHRSFLSLKVMDSVFTGSSRAETFEAMINHPWCPDVMTYIAVARQNGGKLKLALSQVSGELVTHYSSSRRCDLGRWIEQRIYLNLNCLTDYGLILSRSYFATERTMSEEDCNFYYWDHSR